VTVYGSKSCPDSVRARHYLDAHQIPYEFKDLDDSPELNEYVASVNNGKRVIPTIRVENDLLINPDDITLAAAVAAAAPGFASPSSHQPEPRATRPDDGSGGSVSEVA